MADLFAEIDEDVRADRVRAAARRWAPVAAAIAVAAVIGVGAWQAMLSHREARDTRLSGVFLEAEMAADDQSASGADAAHARALTLFRSLEAAPRPGIRTLARLREAQLLGDKGDDMGAVRSLDAVAADTAAPDALRELATLLSVERRISGPNAAAENARLATLERPGEPFRALALEADARLALQAGRTDETRRVLSSLVADGEASTGVRERASTLLQAIGAAAPGVRG